MAACKLRGGVDGQERLRSVDRVMELMTARVGVASEPVKLRLAIACMHGSAWDRAAVLFDDAVSTRVCAFRYLSLSGGCVDTP